jgi:hypothetical protein
MVPFKLLCLEGQDSTCRYVRCNTRRRAVVLIVSGVEPVRVVI